MTDDKKLVADIRSASETLERALNEAGAACLSITPHLARPNMTGGDGMTGRWCVYFTVSRVL